MSRARNWASTNSDSNRQHSPDGFAASSATVPSATSTAAWPAKLADAYVRGDDLVATFQATDDWPFAPQVYWRADTLESIDQVLGSVSLVVSVSTHLLDTHPRICAVTQLAADEVFHVVPTDDDGARTTSLSGRKRIGSTIPTAARAVSSGGCRAEK